LNAEAKKSFRLRRRHFSFARKEKRSKKKARPALSSSCATCFQARLRNSLRSNSARLHRLSTALLGDNEGIEKH